MCMGVVIKRDGLPPIHCGTVRELARWFDVMVPEKIYPNKRVDRMARHCLCAIDIVESARLSGYRAAPDDNYMDFIAEKASVE